MSETRAVRIPRARLPSPAPPPVARPPVPIEEIPVVERRANRGGVQRAQRLAVGYVAVLFIVYAGFAVYDRSTPSGATAGSASNLLLFGVVALILALSGVVLSMISAPRAVELSTRATRILGSLGLNQRFPPIASVHVRIVRRYPAGFLSSVPTVSAELTAGALRRTYLLEEGLLTPNRDGDSLG
jgi:hypothetical protein